MNLKNTIQNLNRQSLTNILFYSIILFLPLNLGKHFIANFSYVGGILSDYLIPTIWVTDLLIFLLVFFEWERILKGVKEYKSVFNLLLLLALSFLPSIFISTNFLPSLFFFLQLILHITFCFYVFLKISFRDAFKKSYLKILKIFKVLVLLLFILSVLQWVNQGSVFDNYLFFGEQPYSSATPKVALTNFFGTNKVSVYGTFRHPNILGGFMSIILVWLLFAENYLFFGLGFLVVFLTFSDTSMLSLLLGSLFFLSIKRLGRKGVFLALLLTAGIFIGGLVFPMVLDGSYNDPSVFERINLFKSANLLIEKNLWWGSGINSFTNHFVQPVHNVFALILSEGGVFALSIFLGIFIFSGLVLLNQPFGLPAVLFVNLLQFVILGSFDHYFWTIIQTQLLFWLTLGFILTYTKHNA